MKQIKTTKKDNLNLSRVFLSFIFLISSVVVPESFATQYEMYSAYSEIVKEKPPVHVDLSDTCNQESKVWTNWDRKPFITGLLELSGDRERLNKNKPFRFL